MWEFCNYHECSSKASGIADKGGAQIESAEPRKPCAPSSCSFTWLGCYWKSKGQGRARPELWPGSGQMAPLLGARMGEYCGQKQGTQGSGHGGMWSQSNNDQPTLVLDPRLVTLPCSMATVPESTPQPRVLWQFKNWEISRAVPRKKALNLSNTVSADHAWSHFQSHHSYRCHGRKLPSPLPPDSGALHLGPTPSINPALCALRKLPNFSMPQFPHLWKEEIIPVS